MTTTRTIPAMPASDLALLTQAVINLQHAEPIEIFDALRSPYDRGLGVDPTIRRAAHIMLHPRFDGVGAPHTLSCSDCDDDRIRALTF